ncbi:MAG: hypothetical protein JNM51_14515 [Bacteroidia bacterium]|nr:hypothetical protein [Bacteroidia bacterium]
MKLKINHLFLIQCLYFALSATTAYQKIVELTVPEWFIHKFENSFIAIIPFGISISFIVISFLELTIAISMVISVLNREFLIESDRVVFNFGLDLSLVLFVILFFGSFLVGDYNNGAFDFMYFIATLFIRKKIIF